MSTSERADLVVGWHGIGSYLGSSADTARRLGREAGLPTFRLSAKKVASTRDKLDAWIAERAASGPSRSAA